MVDKFEGGATSELGAALAAVGTVEVEGVRTIASPVLVPSAAVGGADDVAGEPALLGAEEKANHALAQIGPILARMAALEARLESTAGAVLDPITGDFRRWAEGEVALIKAAIANFNHPIR